jgi:AraC family transcriptional regulator
MTSQSGDVLDVSKVTTQHSFHGLELPLRTLSGARLLRVVHPAGQRIPEHRHDWPLLTIPALGGYEEQCDDRSMAVHGPAVVLHPPGRCHANYIHALGMETFSIEFDPAWIGIAARSRMDRSFYWLGGEVPLAARALLRLWVDPATSDEQVRQGTAEFVAYAIGARESRIPAWLGQVQAQLHSSEAEATSTLASVLGLHPRWLAHAYRSAVGEGLHETVRRRRLERAAYLLRATDYSIAAIAADTGFCDQSHLNRVMRSVTGRTPVQMRAERQALATLGRAT